MTANTEIHSLLRSTLEEARDLLLETRQGHPARSAGHNARLAVERALTLIEGPVMVERIKRAREGADYDILGAIKQQIWDRIEKRIEDQPIDGKNAEGDYNPRIEGEQLSYINGLRSARLSAITVLKDAIKSAPVALDTAARVGDDTTETDDLLHSLNRDGSWLRAWRSAYKVGTHPDPSIAMQQIVEDIFWAVSFIEAKRAIATIPTTTAGRAETLDSNTLMEIIRTHLTERVRSVVTRTVWKDGIDIDEPTMEISTFALAIRRALSSAPTPQPVTVDDAAVERAIKAYEGHDNWLACPKGYREYLTEKMTAALTAAFPQRRED